MYQVTSYNNWLILRETSLLLEIWNQIVDTVAELRFEECAEMMSYSVKSEEVVSHEYQFRDIRDVVQEAKMLIFDRHAEKITEEDKQTSEEQLNVVKNLLKKLKK